MVWRNQDFVDPYHMRCRCLVLDETLTALLPRDRPDLPPAGVLEMREEKDIMNMNTSATTMRRSDATRTVSVTACYLGNCLRVCVPRKKDWPLFPGRYMATITGDGVIKIAQVTENDYTKDGLRRMIGVKLGKAYKDGRRFLQFNAIRGGELTEFQMIDATVSFIDEDSFFLILPRSTVARPPLAKKQFMFPEQVAVVKPETWEDELAKVISKRQQVVDALTVITEFLVDNKKAQLSCSDERFVTIRIDDVIQPDVAS